MKGVEMAKSKGILLVVGVVAAVGIAYLTIDGRVGPIEGVEGTIGGASDQHQSEKTRYYEELNKRVESLSVDKIEAIGTIAAKFESAPAEAEKMLVKHGWSKEEFDELLKGIRDNDEMNKVFQAAKKLASHQ